MSADWNYADVWETVAHAVPGRIAQIHGGRRIGWGEFDARANGVATALLQAGCGRQDKVALYLHNGPEYLQSAFACMKAALVPVNTNYRYRQDELHYLWDNADATAVVFHGEFTAIADQVRPRCGKVRSWIHVDDGSGPCPSWAIPYEQAALSHPARLETPWDRSGDDQVLIYTGGTTGRPRGVMWRQHDLYVASNTTGDPATADLAHVRRRVEEAGRGGLPVGMPAAPLMHGTAYVFASAILNRAGCVVTLPSTKFDERELLDVIQAEQASDLCIVGDAFCRPMVDALDAEPGRWNLTGLKAISSSGMMWSGANKIRLLEHAPNAVLIDFLNSSEASGMGRAIASRGRPAPSARFKLGKNAFVIDDENRRIAPGSGIAGRIAVSGELLAQLV